MAVFLRDTPIKRKLMLVILLTNGFVLLLMGSALITFELVTFRRSLATNIGVLADIIGANGHWSDRLSGSAERSGHSRCAFRGTTDNEGRNL